MRNPLILKADLTGIPKKILIALFKFYQKNISVFTKPRCRFIPTCSSYAVEAVEKYGAVKGLWVACKRFLRCNPFCRSGYDPVK